MFPDDFEIDTNVIRTPQSNADLELRANGTGKVRMPANNVKIDNDLTVTGTTTLSNLVAPMVTLILQETAHKLVIQIFRQHKYKSKILFVDESAQFDEIRIENNVISITTNADMEIRASGTGRILIPDNDVVITNNLEVAGDLIVNSASEQQEKLQLRAFTTDGILIETNFITTTESNSDLELRTSGTGDILLNDDIKINFTTIQQ